VKRSANFLDASRIQGSKMNSSRRAFILGRNGNKMVKMAKSTGNRKFGEQPISVVAGKISGRAV
jgi:hypothetical protein